MTEALSLEEIECLLDGLENNEADSLDHFPPLEGADRAPLQALRAAHEDLSQRFGAAASAVLRTPVECKLCNVDRAPYHDYLNGLSSSSNVYVIKAEPLEGPLLLEIDSSLQFPVIDRLLGGSSNTPSSVRRPLTELEVKLMRRFAEVLLAAMRQAWKGVLTLEILAERTESDPQSICVMPPGEPAIHVNFELTLGDVLGRINLYMPMRAFDFIGGQHSAIRCVKVDRQSVVDWLSGPIVEVVAELAATSLSAANIMALRVGDIVSTERDASGPLTVSIDGQPKYHATPGTYKGRKAVRIVAPTEEHRQRTIGNR